MDKEKYERDGKYAAESDFKISRGYLLDTIRSAYEAATSAAVTDTFEATNLKRDKKSGNQ